jgi:hypothetical protein
MLGALGWVDFDALSEYGWLKAEGFDWNQEF